MTHVALGYAGRRRALDEALPLQQREHPAGGHDSRAEVWRERERLAHHPRAEDQRLRYPDCREKENWRKWRQAKELAQSRRQFVFIWKKIVPSSSDTYPDRVKWWF